MRKIAKVWALGILCGTAAIAVSINQSEAGVMSVASKEVLGQSSPVETVHYRRWSHHHYWRHAHWGHHYWHHAYWRHHHWHHAYWRHHHYAYYPYYNPAGAVAGAAVGLATAPLWALGGYYGYPYY